MPSTSDQKINSNNSIHKNLSEIELAENSSDAVVVMCRRRNTSEPSMSPTEKIKAARPQDKLEYESHKSEKYIYRSPSKMTSPEKREFS